MIFSDVYAINWWLLMFNIKRNKCCCFLFSGTLWIIMKFHWLAEHIYASFLTHNLRLTRLTQFFSVFDSILSWKNIWSHHRRYTIQSTSQSSKYFSFQLILLKWKVVFLLKTFFWDVQKCGIFIPSN